MYPEKRSVNEALDALVCGYAPRWRAQKVLVMMQAFSDDSMSGEGSKILLLAGCVQKYPVWADFTLTWEAALARRPSINYFKMREARLFIKQYGWKAKERDAKIDLLADVILQHRPKIITAWISRKEFEEIVRPVIPYMLRHPYIPLFYSLITKLAQWQHEAANTLPTDFAFD